MANYIIIGGDGKEYGPVSDTNVRQWIAEGRLAPNSLAKIEGTTELLTLEKFPEFAADFIPATLKMAPDPLSPPTISPLATGNNSRSASSSANDFMNRDYDLDIGGCISQGFELVKNNLGVYFVGVLIYFAVEFVIAMLGNIPFIGPIFSLGNFLIAGAFMGGVLWMFLRGVRGEPAEVGDVFEGFKRAFGQLFLATLVQGLLVMICMLPFIVMFVIQLVRSDFFSSLPAHTNFQNDPAALQKALHSLLSLLLITLPALIICWLPAIYLGTCWKFSLPLIMDKGMDFWTAMKTSMKMVNKHWWQVFGLIIVTGLLNLAGACACCVGLLFTVPVGFAALMFAYETIVGERKN